MGHDKMKIKVVREDLMCFEADPNTLEQVSEEVEI